jgi:hypothetical protein
MSQNRGRQPYPTREKEHCYKVILDLLVLPHYSFGMSVRTSTLCMTCIFSNNCLQTYYFTYNSLYHNSSGSEVYITKLLCLYTAWKIPKGNVMALEKSDGLIDIIWVKWRCTCSCNSRPTFKLSASLLGIMWKSKEISQDLRRKM